MTWAELNKTCMWCGHRWTAQEFTETDCEKSPDGRHHDTLADTGHWQDVERAVGTGAPSLLLGTSTGALRKSLARMREVAAQRAEAERGGTNPMNCWVVLSSADQFYDGKASHVHHQPGCQLVHRLLVTGLWFVGRIYRARECEGIACRQCCEREGVAA